MIKSQRTIWLTLMFGLAFLAGAPLMAQSVAAVTGAHANVEFYKPMIRQVDLGAAYVKANPGLTPDMRTRAQYFADQKALNATLRKSAPRSLATDVALFTRNADAINDAQIAGKPAGIKAAVTALTGPEHLAAARRANAYCGVRVHVSR